MNLCVNKKRQASSGGDFVVIYEADIEMTANADVLVSFAGVYPTDACPDQVQLAKDAIRLGAIRVLQPRGVGAVIRVRRIVINDVDFNPQMFERFTADELQRLLGETATAHDITPESN
jgi:hypothetical protein